jgi:hypothetical protein
MKKTTYTTVRMAARNVAKEAFTACNELANLLSIVSISFPKRLSKRPMVMFMKKTSHEQGE